MKFPCNICEKNVASNHNAICCDICNKWVHISCNNISRYCYRKLQKDSTPWYCKNCLKQVLPYNKLTDYQLKALMLDKVLTSPKLLLTNDHLLFPDEECENAAKTEVMTPDDFYQVINNNSNNHFLHMNISSVFYHIDDLNTFVMNWKIKPKVTGISECRIKTGRPPLSNINMNNYSYEYTPTESSKGRTLLYIDKNLRYRSRSDLTLYKSKEIESSFIEIIEPKKKSTIVGCIYKHPNVSVGEFTNDFLEPLLEKLSFEKKEVILMRDYNINLLNCNIDKNTSDYVDTLYSHAFFPRINSPT